MNEITIVILRLGDRGYEHETTREKMEAEETENKEKGNREEGQ